MSSSAKKPASKKAEPTHPTYNVMVKAAIASLKSRSGSSRQAIVKYVVATYKLKEDSANTFVKQTLKRLAVKGEIVHTKGAGASGSFKIPKPVADATKKPAAAKKSAASKKTTTNKKKVASPAKAKKAVAKKASPKKPAAKKTAVKKPAAKKTTVKKTPSKKTVKPKKPVAKKPAAKKATTKKATKK